MALTAYRTRSGIFQKLRRRHDGPYLADKWEQMRKNTCTELHHRSRPACNRRAEKRLLCSDLIQLRWVDRQGARHEEIVVMEGYSNSGASMLMGLPIAEGTVVTLCGGGEVLRAVVRHCDPAQNGYLVGVCFWEHSRRYVPEHLLDPSLLSYEVEP